MTSSVVVPSSSHVWLLLCSDVSGEHHMDGLVSTNEESKKQKTRQVSRRWRRIAQGREEKGREGGRREREREKEREGEKRGGGGTRV